jgi:hypothetical protein
LAPSNGIVPNETILNHRAELFDSDLERSTVAVILENQALLQENKQSTSLMTDYEHTVETVMTKFRQHAVRNCI